VLVVQIVKKGWYIDFKVNSIADIPTKFIPCIREIGEEKYGTDNMCYIILPLRRMEPSIIRGRDYLPAVTEGEGKGTSEGNGGGVGGHDSRPLRDSSTTIARGRGDMVWWCSGEKSNMVPQISWRRGVIRMVSVNQIVKLDIDVDVDFYDPNWLLEKKLQMLHSLGYQEDDAGGEF